MVLYTKYLVWRTQPILSKSTEEALLFYSLVSVNHSITSDAKSGATSDLFAFCMTPLGTVVTYLVSTF